MNIVGSTDILLVFPSDDQVRNVTVRVVEGLPYGMIVGAAFLRQNGSMINFADRGGFKPTPGPPWVSFVTAGKHQTEEAGAKTSDWQAAPAKKRGKYWRPAETYRKEVAPWEQFCAITTDSTEQEPPNIAAPSTFPVLGEAAWEDDGTLQWKLYSGKQVELDGFVSVQTETFVKGTQPQERQLVLVTPVAPYDLASGAELGVARGVQWWYPYTPIQCKTVNVMDMPKTLQRGAIAANVYAMNASDVERMRLLLEPPPPDPDPDAFGGDVVNTNGQADTPPKHVDLSEANIG